MTPDDLPSHKEAIKKAMLDHLTTVGWPNVPNETVLRELKNMWIKIEEAGLILPGMTFEAFCSHANDQFLLSEINDIIGI